MPASSLQSYPGPESYFTIGPYITDPQKFFGREEELRAILHLRSMIGSREIGLVTAGEMGAFCRTSASLFYQPAFQVNVVDTTGAGVNRFEKEKSGLISRLFRDVTLTFNVPASFCGLSQTRPHGAGR